MTYLEQAKGLLLEKTTQGQKIIALRNKRIDGSYASWSEAAVIDAHTEFLFDDGICVSLYIASACDHTGDYQEYVDQIPYLTVRLSGQTKDFLVCADAKTLKLGSGEYFWINGNYVNIKDMSDAEVFEHLILGSHHIVFYSWIHSWRYVR